MTTETPHQEKIPPSEKTLETPTEIVYSLSGMFVSVIGLIVIGYMHGHMNLSAVLKNLG